jgi:hypothetical protein
MTANDIHPTPQAIIENLFTYHAPTGDQPERDALRVEVAAARKLDNLLKRCENCGGYALQDHDCYGDVHTGALNEYARLRAQNEGGERG